MLKKINNVSQANSNRKAIANKKTIKMNNQEKIKAIQNFIDNNGNVDDCRRLLIDMGDYNIYLKPIIYDFDKQLERLPAAGYLLCTVLLVMLVFEDRLNEGSFKRRCKEGYVKKILTRMIELLKYNTYGEYLNDRLKELCITETELAKEIGVNQKTIIHYLECEETGLKNKIRQLDIELALEKFSAFNGYYYINRIKFDVLHENSSYGEYLNDRLKELCITETELAKEIDVNQKTISHYLEYEEIELEKKQKIEIALEKFSVFNGYYHMNRAEFGDLLSSLLNEFKITQDELAKAIGKHQKDISGYINKEKSTRTQLQYEILEFFYKKCNFEYGISSEHYNTMMKLMRLIRKYDYEEQREMIATEDLNDYDDYEFYSENCKEYILQLPVVLQNFIIQNYAAYFEEVMFYVDCSSNIFYSYYQRCELMKIFCNMSADEQHEFVSKLEQCTLISYPKNDEEKKFFDCITAMRKIITSDIPFTDFNELMKIEKSRSKTSQRKFIDELNCILCNLGTYSTSVEELKMKLSFTRYEWYVWMLLLINFYNGTFPELYYEVF